MIRKPTWPPVKEGRRGRGSRTATLSKKAHQVMTRRPIVISPDHTLVDAAQLMNDNKVNCLLVVDEAEQLQGVLTSSDLLLTVFESSSRSQRIE